MDGEEGQFQAIGDTSLVIDTAQVVFDDLFGGAKPLSDLFVFAALDDQSNDLHFLRGKPVADACADEVFFFRLGKFCGSLYTGQTLDHFLYTVNQRRTRRVSVDHTADAKARIGA